MSDERIGMEKALPMFLLGLGCLVATAIVFGILCGNMIRSRRKIEKIEREDKEQYLILQRQTLSNNTNQSAAIRSSHLAIALDSTFKIHPNHIFSNKRIVEL